MDRALIRCSIGADTGSGYPVQDQRRGSIEVPHNDAILIDKIRAENYARHLD
jgi:hypothetical protein